MKLTPMLQQYMDAKEKHPDAVLFFRMGDFYECFFEDALLVADVLELTLTSRDKDSANPIPMAGVPHHSSEGYVRRLLEAGHSVAICEQLEEPSQAKGIVRRGVTRVVTPGMRLDTDSIDAKSNNFAVALALSDLKSSDSYAVGAVDVSTGELRLSEALSADAVITELQRLQPAEVVVAERSLRLFEPWVQLLGAHLVVRDDERLRLERVIQSAGKRTLEEPDFGLRMQLMKADELRTLVARLDDFTLRDRKAMDSCLALLLDWVADTQGGIPNHLEAPTIHRSSDYLALDPASSANLEIFETLMGGRKQGSLFSSIDLTVTAAGGRRLRTWLSYPLRSVSAIRGRQNAVTALVQAPSERQSLREGLRKTADVQRVTTRLSAGQGNARDLKTLEQTLAALPELTDVLRDIQEPALRKLIDELDPCQDVSALLSVAIDDEPPVALNEGGLIKKGYNDELDELIELSTSGKQWLLRYENEQRQATGISSLKIKHNKVFGYYIEITRANLEHVPETYIRKQTLANAERYFTPELKEYEDKILSASDRRHALEYKLFEEIRAQVLEELGRLRDIAWRLAELDALASLAELAQRENYVAPVIEEEPGIHIEEGRHPVVEKMLVDERFVPNDTRLSPEERVLIITGPNMAGKSTVIRQVALIALLAQIGSHVPARSARIGVVDQIFSRVGASDNLARGQSTFMVEMSEVAHILNRATASSLIILDEIGRGTSTWDGLSIAWSVAEHLHDSLGAFALFATHYHELTDLARTRDAVRNYNIAVREWNDEIIFLRKLVEGPANRSYGIQVARLAGVPDPVVERAKEILANLESSEFDSDQQPTIAREFEEDGRPVRRPAPQLGLFEAGDAPADRTQTAVSAATRSVLRELESMAVNRTTPLDALQLIDRWQRALQRERNRR